MTEYVSDFIDFAKSLKIRRKMGDIGNLRVAYLKTNWLNLYEKHWIERGEETAGILSSEKFLILKTRIERSSLRLIVIDEYNDDDIFEITDNNYALPRIIFESIQPLEYEYAEQA